MAWKRNRIIRALIEWHLCDRFWWALIGLGWGALLAFRLQHGPFFPALWP